MVELQIEGLSDAAGVVGTVVAVVGTVVAAVVGRIVAVAGAAVENTG